MKNEIIEPKKELESLTMKELIHKLETDQAIITDVCSIKKADGTLNKKLANFLDLTVCNKLPIKFSTIRVKTSEVDDIIVYHHRKRLNRVNNILAEDIRIQKRLENQLKLLEGKRK